MAPVVGAACLSAQVLPPSVLARNAPEAPEAKPVVEFRNWPITSVSVVGVELWFHEPVEELVEVELLLLQPLRATPAINNREIK